MREDRALHRLAADIGHLHAGEEVEAVHVAGIVRNLERATRFFHIDDRLEHDAAAVLYELTHGMQVRRVVDAGREESPMILALTLAVELLPPFGHEMEAGLIVDQDLDRVAFAQQDVADHGVLIARILRQLGILVGIHRVLGAAHHLADVDAGRGDRQESDGREDRVAAADIVGHDEGLVALFVSQLLERAPALVGRDIDAAFGLFPSVALFHIGFEQAERDCRFRGRAGFGDDVDGDALVRDEVEQVAQIRARNAVAREQDQRGLTLTAGNRGVEIVAQQLDCGTGAQVRSADADDHEDVRVTANFLRGLADAREFHLVILDRQLQPAKVLGSGAGLFM